MKNETVRLPPLTLPVDLAAQIEVYRFEKRHETRAAAIRALLQLGLAHAIDGGSMDARCTCGPAPLSSKWPGTPCPVHGKAGEDDPSNT